MQHASSGIEGLDEIMRGGFTRGAVFLIEGTAGAGKTMLALQWALKGVKEGEQVLYVAFSESRRELESIAKSNGWDLSGIHVLESLRDQNKHTMFHPAEVELEITIGRVREEIERVGASRAVIDSLAEIRLLSQSDLRYHRELSRFRNFSEGHGCTVLLLDEPTRPGMAYLASGVVQLEHSLPEYGGARRRLSVTKMRGRGYAGGYHDFIIQQGGLQVFPRLIAAEHRGEQATHTMSSGIESLDALCGGGIPSGTSTLVIGPAGAAKSSVAQIFAVAAAERGESAVIFTFDERPELIIRRLAGLGLSVGKHMDSGLLRIQQVDPAEFPPGQLAHLVRQEVQDRQISVMVLDSLNGYLHTMPGASFLTAQMHELLTYLGQRGVTSFLIMGQSGVLESVSSPVDASYLTDNLIWLRLFESGGRIRRSIAIVKQRAGQHRHDIHELTLGAQGISVGGALPNLSDMTRNDQ